LLNVCDLYAKNHALAFNVKKPSCAAVGRHRYVEAMLFLDEQVVPWTDKFKYSSVHFNCGNRIDINPVKRHFYAACNSILAKSHAADEPVI